MSLLNPPPMTLPPYSHVDLANFATITSPTYLHNYTYLQFSLFPQLFQMYLNHLTPTQLQNQLDSYLNTLAEFVVENMVHKEYYDGRLWGNKFEEWLVKSQGRREKQEDLVKGVVERMAREIREISTLLTTPTPTCTIRSIITPLQLLPLQLNFLQSKIYLRQITHDIQRSPIACGLFELIKKMVRFMVRNGHAGVLKGYFSKCENLHLVHVVLGDIGGFQEEKEGNQGRGPSDPGYTDKTTNHANNNNPSPTNNLLNISPYDLSILSLTINTLQVNILPLQIQIRTFYNLIKFGRTRQFYLLVDKKFTEKSIENYLRICGVVGEVAEVIGMLRGLVRQARGNNDDKGKGKEGGGDDEMTTTETTTTAVTMTTREIVQRVEGCLRGTLLLGEKQKNEQKNQQKNEQKKEQKKEHLLNQYQKQPMARYEKLSQQKYQYQQGVSIKQLPYESVEKIAKMMTRLEMGQENSMIEKKNENVNTRLNEQKIQVQQKEEGMQLQQQNQPQQRHPTPTPPLPKPPTLPLPHQQFPLSPSYLTTYFQLPTHLSCPDSCPHPITTLKLLFSHNNQSLSQVFGIGCGNSDGDINGQKSLVKVEKVVEMLERVQMECGLTLEAVGGVEQWVGVRGRDGGNNGDNEKEDRGKLVELTQVLHKVKNSTFTNLLTINVLKSAFTHTNSITNTNISQQSPITTTTTLPTIRLLLTQTLTFSLQSNRSDPLLSLSPQISTLPHLESILKLFGAVQLWKELGGSGDWCQEDDGDLVGEFYEETIKKYSGQNIKIDQREVGFVEMILGFMGVVKGGGDGDSKNNNDTEVGGKEEKGKGEGEEKGKEKEKEKQQSKQQSKQQLKQQLNNITNDNITNDKQQQQARHLTLTTRNLTTLLQLSKKCLPITPYLTSQPLFQSLLHLLSMKLLSHCFPSPLSPLSPQPTTPDDLIKITEQQQENGWDYRFNQNLFKVPFWRMVRVGGREEVLGWKAVVNWVDRKGFRRIIREFDSASDTSNGNSKVVDVDTEDVDYSDDTPLSAILQAQLIKSTSPNSPNTKKDQPSSSQQQSPSQQQSSPQQLFELFRMLKGKYLQLVEFKKEMRANIYKNQQQGKEQEKKQPQQQQQKPQQGQDLNPNSTPSHQSSTAINQPTQALCTLQHFIFSFMLQATQHISQASSHFTLLTTPLRTLPLHNPSLRHLYLSQLTTFHTTLTTSLNSLASQLKSSILGPRLQLFKPSQYLVREVFPFTRSADGKGNDNKNGKNAKGQFGQKEAIKQMQGLQEVFGGVLGVGVFALAYLTWVMMELRVRREWVMGYVKEEEREEEEGNNKKEKGYQQSQQSRGNGLLSEDDGEEGQSSTLLFLRTISLINLCSLTSTPPSPSPPTPSILSHTSPSPFPAIHFNFPQVQPLLQSNIHPTSQPSNSPQSPSLSTHPFPPLSLHHPSTLHHLSTLASYEFWEFVYEYLPFDIKSQEEEARLFAVVKGFVVKEDNHQFISAGKREKLALVRVWDWLERLLGEEKIIGRKRMSEE